MQWTDAQKKTIETRNSNILVSAAAGSGKTAVLIERIKGLVLEDKTDIDRFLITTFTNAASAEMKARLEKAIREQMEKPGADRQFLKRQLSLMPRASISTFHTFALEVMRRYFYVTDLEPGFKIGDDTAVSIMKNESVDELFEKRFSEDYERFGDFLRKYSSDRSDKRLKQNIISLYDEMRSIPHYMSWAKESAEKLGAASPTAELGLDRFAAEETARQIKNAAQLYAKAADVLEEAGLEGLYAKAEADAQMVAGMSADAGVYADRISAYGKFLGSLKFNQMRAAKDEKEDYAAVKDQVASLRKSGKKILDDLRGKYYQRSLSEYDEELNMLHADTLYLTELIEEFEQIFKQKKADRNIVDFDDVMHYAIDILSNDLVAAEYRDRFRYIFIDEFQDSNMLQETIIGRIAGKDNLFMVGDVKQSIYKFRLAEPEIFKAKYELYSQESETCSMKIDLSNNFRSKLKVTETVNRVFEKIMDGYDDNARLKCTVNPEHPGMATECHLVTADAGEEEDYDNAKPEEKLILELIRQSLGREIYDVKKGVFRNAEYRDIVVLSRSKSSIKTLERFLNNEGVPAFGENTGGYFETVEVQVFTNLLRIIDNTSQDIPLISVMRCPVFDFSVKELASIRIEKKDGGFYDAVKAYAQDGRDENLRGKTDRMLQQLAYWKELKNTIPLEELIRILMYDTGYFDYCSGLPSGKQRISNLRLLVEKAEQFEQSSHSGLYGFITYIEAMKNNNLSVGEAKIIGENENVVRVMTVHKSKGLEFPIVILAGTGRMIKYKGAGGSIMHKDFAIAMPHVNRDEKWHRKTLLQRVIESQKANEEFEEEIRILYVAMTRAMDQLLLTGTVKDPQKLEEIVGTGRSFAEMVYGPMTDAGECVVIHAGADDGGEESESAEPESAEAKSAEAEAGTAYVPAAALTDLTAAAGNGEDGGVCGSTEDADNKNAGDTPGGAGRNNTLSTADREKLRNLIDERLSYEYPYMDAAGVKSKYSVTELNRLRRENEMFRSEGGSSADRQIGHPRWIGEETQFGKFEASSNDVNVRDAAPEQDAPEKLYDAAAEDTRADASGEKTESVQHRAALARPAFSIEKNGISSTQAGTVMHLVVEKLDFAEALARGSDYIKETVGRLLDDGTITEEEAGVVRVDNINAFFRAEPGKRAAQAEHIYKEREFILRKNINGADTIVQGIIDCYFEEEDGIVLIDYKNSYAKDADREKELVGRYEGQIEIYREALENAYGKPVKEAYLYLFGSRKFIEVRRQNRISG